jgi:hypothetical protein
MADKKMRVAPGTLMRMEWGTPRPDHDHPNCNLGPSEDFFLATALGRGSILAPDSDGTMRVWGGITFWEPSERTENWCGSATWRGDNESWMYASVAEDE